MSRKIFYASHIYSVKIYRELFIFFIRTQKDITCIPLHKSILCSLASLFYMTSLSAEQFLNRVWPKPLLRNETLELRLRNRETQGIRREFCTSIEQFLIKARYYAAQYDVYFALATRFGSGSGTKRDCYRILCTWADIDHKKIEECKFDPKPDIVVSSGGGVHAYFLLNSPYLVRGEGQRWLPIEEINKGIAKKLKADGNTADIARVLRVPGTMNHKFTPPRKVEAYVL